MGTSGTIPKLAEATQSQQADGMLFVSGEETKKLGRTPTACAMCLSTLPSYSFARASAPLEL